MKKYSRYVCVCTPLKVDYALPPGTACRINRRFSPCAAAGTEHVGLLQARAARDEDKLPDHKRPTILAHSLVYGQAYGVGIGLWFKSLSWCVTREHHTPGTLRIVVGAVLLLKPLPPPVAG